MFYLIFLLFLIYQAEMLIQIAMGFPASFDFILTHQFAKILRVLLIKVAK